jgi:hypothetical protein
LYGVPLHEHRALTRIYNATNGPAWRAQQHWCSTSNKVRDWDRVEVEEGHVTMLMLSGNGLSGPLPWKEITALKELRVLALNGNALEGGIPATEIIKLSKLETLLLHNNRLEGRINAQALRCLEKLERLKLFNPEGPQTLHVDRNRFTLPRGVTPRDLDCFGRESVRDLLKQLNY